MRNFITTSERRYVPRLGSTFARLAAYFSGYRGEKDRVGVERCWHGKEGRKEGGLVS